MSVKKEWCCFLYKCIKEKTRWLWVDVLLSAQILSCAHYSVPHTMELWVILNLKSVLCFGDRGGVDKICTCSEMHLKVRICHWAKCNLCSKACWAAHQAIKISDRMQATWKISWKGPENNPASITETRTLSAGASGEPKTRMAWQESQEQQHLSFFLSLSSSE